jgi:hypothetical protein
METVESLSSNLLIVGEGPTAFDDLERWWDMGIEHDVLCVNYAGRWFPCDFKYWYTYHGDHFGIPRNPDTWWIKKCKALKISFNPGPYIDQIVNLSDTEGSSGLQAVWVGKQHLKYDKIILAGVPMTNEPRISPNSYNKGHYQSGFFHIWMKYQAVLKQFVRSMSGNTMELLGAPTKDFFQCPQ